MQTNYTPTKKSQRIFVAGRVVGTVEEGIFKKSIKFSKHALHTPPALALSVESLRQVEGFGAHEIEITDKESGYVYSCTLEHFKRYSWQLQRSKFEPQRALALERWSVTVNDHLLPVTTTTSAEPTYSESTVTAVQLGFWGR